MAAMAVGIHGWLAMAGVISSWLWLETKVDNSGG